MNSIVDLIGCSIDSIEVRDCVMAFGEASDIVEDGLELDYSFSRHGIGLRFENRHLATVFFYSAGLDGFSGFAGQLPLNITFQDNKQTVEQKVGLSIASSGSVRVPFPGQRESNWVKFRFEKYALHVEFTSSDCESIRLVTAMAPRPSGRLN